MILFNKRCEICGKPTSDQYVNEIDDHIIYIYASFSNVIRSWFTI